VACGTQNLEVKQPADFARTFSLAAECSFPQATDEARFRLQFYEALLRGKFLFFSPEVHAERGEKGKGKWEGWVLGTVKIEHPAFSGERSGSDRA